MEDKKKKTVGVCIVAKNEEVLIGRALESVKGADQIVVVDSGSMDRTIEIAKSYGAEVDYGYVWDDDFASIQNYAKSKMRTDWILSLDCDEVLSCPWEEVVAAVQLAQDTVRCFMIAEGGNRLEFEFSRLFRNTPDIYWVQPIHKHLNVPGAGEPIGNVRITFGWSPAHNNDPDRALRILERTVQEEGDQAGRNLYYLGREYWYKQRYKEAIDTLWKYVLISRWDAEKAESFLVMSQSYSALGQDDEARNAILQAIKLNPEFKEAIEWMAGICKPEHSKQWLRMARTANNQGVLWDRSPAKPVHDTILLETHQDDSVLFAGYTMMRLKPLVISITSSKIQPERGEQGCDAQTRRNETVKAATLLGCPVLFMDIPDTELTEEILRDRLSLFNPETIYIPAVHEGGNSHHNMVGKVALELFGKRCERYCSYIQGDYNIVKGGWEVIPTHTEMELKNKALDCYKSQLNLASTRPHFDAVKNKSEWLI